MKKPFGAVLVTALLAAAAPAQVVPVLPDEGGPRVVFEGTSPYHNIRVVDNHDTRLLCFDNSVESTMSLADHLTGEFEYVDYFPMVWLWNDHLANVLFIGLGGASIQRLFAHDYPQVRLDTAELDPLVAEVAERFFDYRPADRQQLHLLDGRMYLQRTSAKYDAIILDPYTTNRYGAVLPPQLTTVEFFRLLKDHLRPGGVVAYNIYTALPNLQGRDIAGAICRTLGQVFPRVYFFESQTSNNIVFIATLSNTPTDLAVLRPRADALIAEGRVRQPNFLPLLENFRTKPPVNVELCPILTDNYAPVEGLLAPAAPAK
jgi:spermidine synthase